jgi:hypothetical protein
VPSHSSKTRSIQLMASVVCLPQRIWSQIASYVFTWATFHNNSLSDTDPNSDYDLCFDRDIDLSVDASKSGNQSRCANDYRGIAERPNAEFRDCFIKVPCTKRAGGTKWERRVGIFVLSTGKAGKRKYGIRAGEEILISYGKQFWESRKLMAQFREDFEMLKVADAALQG